MTAQFFPLRDAYLCPECDCIGNRATQCVCGNPHGLLCLSAVLNRCDEPTANPERVRAAIDALEQSFR